MGMVVIFNTLKVMEVLSRQFSIINSFRPVPSIIITAAKPLELA